MCGWGAQRPPGSLHGTKTEARGQDETAYESMQGIRNRRKGGSLSVESAKVKGNGHKRVIEVKRQDNEPKGKRATITISAAAGPSEWRLRRLGKSLSLPRIDKDRPWSATTGLVRREKTKNKNPSIYNLNASAMWQLDPENKEYPV